MKQIPKVPETMTDYELCNALIKHFLGENYYIADPVNNIQGNAIILKDIYKRYPSGSIRKIPKRNKKGEA